MTFEQYLQDKRYSAATINRYRLGEKIFTDWLHLEQLTGEEATYSDVIAFMRHLQQKGKSKKTIHGQLNILRHYFTYLITEGKRQDNPAAGVYVRGIVRKLPGNLLGREELEDLYRRYQVQLNVDPAKKIITGVGRVTTQKNWEAFVKIADGIIRTRQDVVFLIVGQGELTEKISQLIKEHDLSSHVIMPGYISDMNAIYSISDIVLNTSLWEGMSYVVLEAMAFSLPLVVTNIPGNSVSVSDNENGYVYDLKDIEKAKVALNKLLDNEDLRKNLGRRGYDYLSTNHKLSTFISEHELLYLKNGKKGINPTG